MNLKLKPGKLVRCHAFGDDVFLLLAINRARMFLCELVLLASDGTVFCTHVYTHSTTSDVWEEVNT